MYLNSKVAVKVCTSDHLNKIKINKPIMFNERKNSRNVFKIDEVK